jgi:dipeptidyl aminopeptidase/acylaminoacyl peptidase
MKSIRRAGGGYIAETQSIRAGWFAALPTLLTFLCLVSASARAADKGRIVFVSDRSGSWQIYTVNPNGTDPVQVTNLAPTADDGWNPTISPNGRKILFNYNAGEGPDLYVINVDGTGLQAITHDHGSLFPHWSPDGKKIAFATVSPRGTGVIAIMPADGTGKRKILTTDSWDSVAPIYTPDGKQIVFQSQMGGYVSAVWIMNSDGSQQRRLTAPALKGAASAVSPDGKHILLLNNLNSPPALPNENFVMNLDGSGLKRLAPLARFHHDLGATYSPDGQQISFYSDRFSNDITEFTYGTFDILTMDATGGNIKDIVTGAGFCPNDGNCVNASWGVSPTP